MRIRPYAREDAAAVLALNQGALDAVGPLDSERQPWLVSMCSHALVAADEAVVGFAFVLGPATAYDSVNYRWFVERLDDFGYLDRIVVAADRRRSGIGRLLYDAAEEASRPAGVLACEVYVDPPNQPSLAFHEGRGYRECGRLHQANGKTCAMLTKALR